MTARRRRRRSDMRKFLSFRSSAASDNNDRSPNTPDPKPTRVYWGKPWQSDGEDTDGGCSARTKNPIINSIYRCSEKKGPGESGLRRSQSYSSPSRYGALLENQSDHSTSDSSCGHDNATQYPLYSLSLTSKRLPACGRCDLSMSPNEDLPAKIDSSSSCKDYPGMSGISAYSSPFPMKNKASYVTQDLDKNETLDLYIDGEQQERKPNNQRFSPNITNDGYLAENGVLLNSGQPPRTHSTAPPPTRDVKDFPNFPSIEDWASGNTKPTFPPKHRKRFVQIQSHALNESPRIKSHKFYLETTTIEDIYKDTSEPRQGLSSNGSVMNSQEHNFGLDVHPWSISYEDDIDELNTKLKEAKERLTSNSEIDLENENLDNSNLCVPALLNIIEDINSDRKKLALELLTQIQHRIAERCAAKEALKQAKIDLCTRIKKLEREKSEIRSSLEKELDRRSVDWSSKLEKFQAEERRLRARVQELAEQNVCLQREVLSLSGREAETRSRIKNLEMQVNGLRARLEEVKTENLNLHHNLSEMQECCESAEADRDRIERNYKVRDKESKNLERIVVRLQRMCNEHEKTIAGLRQGCIDEIGKQPAERGDLVSTLQLEQIRLSGVEQTLRKELESYGQEMESLRHENVNLLGCLRSGGSGCDFSFFRLENEMHDRLDYLQNKGMSLLHENNELCGKLLELVKSSQFMHNQEANIEIDGYYVVEYDFKFQSLRRGTDNFRRSLQTLSLVLDEKSQLHDEECHPCPTESDLVKQWKNQITEDNVKFELKAETLLTRILREKLCFKELELEQLQSELASSIRGHEILRAEIQHLQDELSSLNHREKEMKIQTMIKDESFNQLNNRFEECAKELAISRNTLPKVSNERDHLWEEVKMLKEMDLLLNFEVDSLKKKNESLEEDILLKEGQINILKDCLKSSDILCTLDL